MKTWADEQRHRTGATGLDRDAGEGPLPCCQTRFVVSDGLVWWGGLPIELLARIRQRLPRLEAIPDAELYVCGGCRETLLREKLVTREELARGLGMPAKAIAKAWVHDEEFWRRGPSVAPVEVKAQPWWTEYEALWAQRLVLDPVEADRARRQWRSAVRALLRSYQWSGRTEV